MVYTDGIHLIADNEYELHLFAIKINLNRCWFSKRATTKLKSYHPHYDLYRDRTRRKQAHEDAIKAGAKQVTTRQIVIILQYINEIKPTNEIFRSGQGIHSERI